MPQGYKSLSYSTQMRMKLQLLIKQGSLHHGKAWKMDKMNSMIGKIMEFDILKKTLENHGISNIWIMENQGILKKVEEILKHV